MTVSTHSFADYFRAVHGHSPFPWQQRLLDEVLEFGWHRPISVPTASGKTAVLDIALFALACQAKLPDAQRTVPRRIALVVDRRVVVDDAARRAERIRDALTTAPDGILREVADALCVLGGEVGEPVHVAVLRGGIYREERWVRTPVQPTILLSTVDQVGSRLLFRGYGISPYARPIHAGLLANDCLIVLDEAHVSQPFMETLQWLAKYRQMAEKPLCLPFAFIPMSATPPPGAAPIRLTEEDTSHPVLQRRLMARKSAELMVAGKTNDTEFAKDLVEAARPFLTPGRVVAVVANRVAAARAAFDLLRIEEDKRQGRLLELERKLDSETKPARREALEAQCADLRTGGCEPILLTGRARSFERDALLDTWRRRLMAGRRRAESASERPLVVVATQCIEVGADLDFDAMVTECAPLDTLRQRFGRLDRLGELGESAAAIVVRPDAAETDGEPIADPVYGTALARTWRWLRQQAEAQGGGVNFGIEAIESIMSSDLVLSTLNAPSLSAPVVFPAYCDLWAQTSPEPAASPEPAVFLHGPERGEPEVQVVWRADLGPDAARWAEVAALCPPTAGETLSVRLSLVRNWLRSDTSPVLDADMEGLAIPERETRKEKAGPFRPALRWKGLDNSEVAGEDGDVRPGDVLVVPTAYGGCDQFGWNPPFVEPVRDAAEEVRHTAGRRAVLRLHSSLVANWGAAAGALCPLVGLDADSGDVDLDGSIQATIAVVGQSTEAPDWLRENCAVLARDKRRQLCPHPDGGWVLIGKQGRAGETATFSDEEDASSARNRNAIPLAGHAARVRTMAEVFVGRLGLPESLAGDVALAAHLHDLGKADPRFQVWLHGGNRLAAVRAGVLAKSPRVAASMAALAEARRKAGYPPGCRHELLSVRLVESVGGTALLPAADRDLVLHLIASHHGRCRGFAPVVDDSEPVTVEIDWLGQRLQAPSDTGLEHLDSGVAERFWNLIRTYGWWGLAFLETCVRLADHRASENEEREMQA